MKHLFRTVAAALALATAATVATPAQAALPITMEGTACALSILCGDGTIVFGRRGRGTIDLDVLGVPYVDTFRWRYVASRNVVQMLFSNGQIGEFTPFHGCGTGTFPAGGFDWDFTICIVP
ncbi:MAG: hypothetical protein H6733_13385 [Alphaproteobacteria bacterium]|nr:hypothetical protein [Alphaproteobacteria bacterium]